MNRMLLSTLLLSTPLLSTPLEKRYILLIRSALSSGVECVHRAELNVFIERSRDEQKKRAPPELFLFFNLIFLMTNEFRILHDLIKEFTSAE